MDERETMRRRLNALLDELSEVNAKLDSEKMRADLAEERAAYAEYQLIECMEAKDGD